MFQRFRYDILGNLNLGTEQRLSDVCHQVSVTLKKWMPYFNIQEITNVVDAETPDNELIVVEHRWTWHIDSIILIIIK